MHFRKLKGLCVIGNYEEMWVMKVGYDIGCSLSKAVVWRLRNTIIWFSSENTWEIKVGSKD